MVCIVLNTVLLPAAVRWCGTARSVRENQYSTLYDRQGRLGLLQALAHTPSVDVTVTIIVISYSVIPLCIYQFCVSICVLLCHVCVVQTSSIQQRSDMDVSSSRVNHDKGSV